ncbi:hypothetical protein D3C80_437910 [compost metagenome]|jgi:hypothetical protein
MMRHLPLAIGATAALLAGAASAEEFAFAVTGSAPQVCALGDVTFGGGAAVNVSSVTPGSIRINQLTDPATLSTNAASAEMSFPAVCTVAHRVRVQSLNNGLWRSQASGVNAASGFANAVPYTVGVQWGESNSRFEVNAASRGAREQSILQGQPAAGDLTLTVSITEGASNLRTDAPLMAGVYADTLVVTLEPQ